MGTRVASAPCAPTIGKERHAFVGGQMRRTAPLLAALVAGHAAACTNGDIADTPCHLGDRGEQCFGLAGTPVMPRRLVPDLYEIVVDRRSDRNIYLEPLDEGASA